MAKKGGGSQTVTQKLDPQTQQMQGEIYRRAQQASTQPYTAYQGQTVAGVSPLATGAAGSFQQLGGLAGLGGAAMAGDPSAFGRFMNPYLQNVVGQVGQQFNQLRNQATLDTNQQATQAGAFGGSRHGIMQGERLGQLDRAQADQTAQLLNQGFNDSWNRAQQTANFGFGALGSQFAAGDYFRNVQQQGLDDNQRRFNEARDWDVRNLDILKSGMTGTPYGQSQTQPTSRNALAGAAGGALTGFQLGGPVGGIIGGGLGLLGL
jgi:hypothetical protein